MTEFIVTRAHLKNAVDARNWDLLDKLLEINTKHLNDNAYYTDTWGDWWGLLLECVYNDEVNGVKVLLKHGAKKNNGRWGDCIPQSPKEAAENKPDILALLQAKTRPDYIRQTDPKLPKSENRDDQTVNRQGEVRDQTGMIFQTDALKKKR